MLSFGLQNLRRLHRVETVELRPITILVGRNSSGKSTFLRALPLVRQSITTRTSSPILWYGDLVDFGDFDGAVFKNEKQLPIRFSFGLDRIVAAQSYYIDSDGKLKSQESEFLETKVTISIVKDGDGTRVSNLSISEASNGVIYDLELKKKRLVTKLVVDGIDVTEKLGSYQLYLATDSLFSNIIGVSKVESDKATTQRVGRVPSDFESIREEFIGLVKERLHGRTTKDSVAKIVDSLSELNSFDHENLISLAKKTTNRSAKKLLEDIARGEHSEFYLQIRLLYLVGLLPRISEAASDRLKEVLGSILYIGPARARSDRYYRYPYLR